VSAGGAKIAHTPAMKPDDHRSSAKTTINIAADGMVTGRTEESATGALAVVLRSSAAAVQTLGDEAAARRLLQKYLTPGTGHFELANLANTIDPVVIRSSFSLDDRFKAPSLGARAVITHGMPLVAWPGTILFGDRLGGRQSPFVCLAGRETEDIETSFDSGLPLPVPLAPVIIDNRNFSYKSNMTVEGRTLKSHREFVSKVERQVCSPELEAQIAADLATVRNHVFSGFAFGSGPSAGLANVAAPGGQRSVVAQSAPAGLGAIGAQTVELTRVAAGELRARLDFLTSIEPDCSSIGQTTVRVVAQPQHGMLAVENGQGFTSFPKDNPRSECNTRRSDGTLVFYQPNSDYSGADSITLYVIFPSGNAQTRHYSIDVNPPKPQTIELTRVAAGELRVRLDFLYSIEPNCASAGQTTVRVVAQPQHGTLALENGQGFTNFPKDNQRYECNTRRSDGTLVFYKPDSDFSGGDSAALYVIYPNGAAQTRHYSIAVK
jgi:hypothetical protein